MLTITKCQDFFYRFCQFFEEICKFFITISSKFLQQVYLLMEETILKNFLNDRLIAHRGVYYNCRENTISAFKEAIKRNYIIELDVRLTKDKKVIVFHVLNLLRLTGINKNISTSTYDELNSIINIPTLEEAIKFVKGRVPIIIEIKSINKKYELEKEVANILDKFDYEFAIQSFNILSLRWFKKNNPQYIRGYLVNGIYSQNKLFNIFILSKLFKYNIAPYYIGIDIKSLDNNNSKKARKKYNIIGYTINNKKEYEKYHNLADNFICNIGKEPFY